MALPARLPAGARRRQHAVPSRPVAQVADPQTGVATYNTYKTTTGWSVAGGTSVATPIVTSVYALAT